MDSFYCFFLNVNIGFYLGKFHEALLQNIPQGKCAGPRTPQALSQFVNSNGQFTIGKNISKNQKMGLALEEEINK